MCAWAGAHVCVPVLPACLHVGTGVISKNVKRIHLTVHNMSPNSVIEKSNNQTWLLVRYLYVILILQYITTFIIFST